MPIQHIEEPSAPRAARQPPTAYTVWQLVFFPFYLAAAMLGALATPLWKLWRVVRRAGSKRNASAGFHAPAVGSSSQATPTSKGTVIKMESFALWQARVAENAANDDRGAVLFLAYQSVSEAQAIAAGLELVGTTWDISGVQVKAYKPKPAGALQYGCVVCGVNSKHYQGMYCCGKKRIAVS
ncbi:hypothetical protein RCH14_002858 [Massilia sp. MP_M2]|uniref:hypothetical protein n=1 Tax=Massilia sp. MP_M2 TaxID=3071713 RepID=UPI00319DB451